MLIVLQNGGQPEEVEMVQPGVVGLCIFFSSYNSQIFLLPDGCYLGGFLVIAATFQHIIGKCGPGEWM